MKKIRLIFCFTAISVILLVLQIAIFHIFLYSKPTTSGSNQLCLKTVQSIVNLATDHNIPLILIDRDYLQSISNGIPVKFKSIVTLATFSKFLNSKLNFIDAIKTSGFKVITLSGPNRRLLQHGYHVTIPLHHFFIEFNCGVHLIILYEREMNYWWHGEIELKMAATKLFSEMGIKFDWNIHETALDKFEIYPSQSFLNLHLPSNIPNLLQSLSNSRFIECNYTRADLFWRQHGGRDQSNEAVEFKSDAWRLLAKTKSLLDSLSVPFWLSSGTCLGYFRQCDIIRHSRDVDLGIWIKDYNPRIISTLSENGLPLKHLFGRPNDSFELSFQGGDIKLDIFFFYEEKDYVWNGGTQARTGKKFKYIFPKFVLCWTEFLELKLRVPCETEPYILANYGPLWMTPIKTWDWKKSPSNVQENGHWPEEEWPIVIRLFQTPGS